MLTQDFREKNRRSEFFNHLSALSESIPALGWVTVVSNRKFLLKLAFHVRGFYPRWLSRPAQEKPCCARSQSASRVHGNTLMATHVSKNCTVAAHIEKHPYLLDKHLLFSSCGIFPSHRFVMAKWLVCPPLMHKVVGSVPARSHLRLS